MRVAIRRPRTLAAVPREVELGTDGEVWATLPMTPAARAAVLLIAFREHQSIERAVERFVLRFLRDAARRESA